MPQSTMTRFRRTLLACGLAAAVLTGCTGYDWDPAAPPAAGVLVSVNGVKVRNLLLVADDSGKAVLFGGAVPAAADTLLGVTVTPISTDSQVGSSKVIEQPTPVPADATTNLTLVLNDTGVIPGSVAAVTLHFKEAGDVSVQVPILAADHPDFKEAFAQARN